MAEAPLPNDPILALAVMSDRAAKMEAVLRLIRINVMGDFITDESGAMRDWLRDWIDGFDNGVVRHSMKEGVMLWPSAMPNICRQLIVWGFRPSEGPHGIKYVTMAAPAPAEGESVN